MKRRWLNLIFAGVLSVLLILLLTGCPSKKDAPEEQQQQEQVEDLPQVRIDTGNGLPPLS